MKRLSEIQKSLTSKKSLINDFGGYNYRSAEQILEDVKKLLKEDETILLSDEMIVLGDRFYVKATAAIIIGKEKIETVAFAREPEIKKGMDASQITGSASSYARKYALQGLFAIDNGNNDPDTLAKHEKKERVTKANYVRILEDAKQKNTKLEDLLEKYDMTQKQIDYFKKELEGE